MPIFDILSRYSWREILIEYQSLARRLRRRNRESTDAADMAAAWQRLKGEGGL